MFGVVREMVSKEKRRYQMDGFDLDLTYMGEGNKIVAMGFPSESMEAAFRNPMKDVLKLLDTKHKDHYKVYNLCSERGYDIEKFHNRVGLYPFDDHNAPPFEMIHKFCKDVQDWLAEHDENIAVIHCKAGKGRTGLMICAWFLYSKMWPTPDEALKYYAVSRTYDQKGVTIPSQLRYVRYFHESLSTDMRYEARALLLKKVVFHTLPKAFSVSDVDYKIYVGQHKTEVFHYKNYVESNKLKDEPKVSKLDKKKKKKKNKEGGENGNGVHSPGSPGGENGESEETETAEFECGAGIPVFGDVKMDFEKQGARIFMFWFNTFFVKDLHVVIEKPGLDKANKDKHNKNYSKHFKVELVFAEVAASTPSTPTTPTTPTTPVIPSLPSTTTTTTTTTSTTTITTL